MLSDLNICDLLQNQYDGAQGVFDYQDTIEGVTFAVKVYPDCVAVLHEGSHDEPDVEHDFEAEIIYPPELNGVGVHAGGWSGLIAAYAEILPYLPKDKLIYLCGHSLGALRVNLAACLLLHHGYTMVERVKFAPPRSNDQALAAMINKYPVRAYENYHSVLDRDFVCAVPRRILPAFPYDVDEPRILIDVPARAGDNWLFLKRHHLFLYREGIKND